ncbi:MAG: tetratricopeptide repeat protein [Desulfuromonadales bacterium]|nr:tetratricopeptide repeat protein [Desulfuromonadales bacterium]
MKRKIPVFIASPNDLAHERRTFKKTIAQLNDGFGDGLDVEFEALGWEDTLAITGQRSQGVINQEIDRCEVFILTLNRRWGQEAPDAQPYSSYTEEEFHRALERFKREGKPEIFVFFKRVDPASEADPGPQLEKVMEFRRQLEETRQVLYHYFEDGESFAAEVDQHLRAYAKDELPKADAERDIVVLPLDALQKLDVAKQLAEQKAKEAEAAHNAEQASRLRIEALHLQMAEDAAELSKEGKLEFARQKFAELVVESSNLKVLFLGYDFYERTGDLDAAFAVLDKWLSLSGEDKKTANTAAAYGNLGLLYATRGELEQAEEMHRKSLAIEEALGCKEGMASDYGNLGNLDQAEEMYRKALTIDEELGRKEGVAIQYGNLGVLYRTRGELDQAEEMYRKSLAINEELGRKEGVAIQYCNLGLLYEERSELDQAQEVWRKSLQLFTELGSPTAERVAGWLEELRQKD